MKQEHVIIVCGIALAVIGVVVYKKTNIIPKSDITQPPKINTTTTDSTTNKPILAMFLQEHSKNGDPYMFGAVKAAKNYLRLHVQNIPASFSNNAEILNFAVQNGMNPSDLTNQFCSGIQ